MRNLLKMMAFALSDLIVSSGRDASLPDHGATMTSGLFITALIANILALLTLCRPDLMAWGVANKPTIVLAGGAIAGAYGWFIHRLVREARTEFGDDEEVRIGIRRQWRIPVLLYLVGSWLALFAAIAYSAIRRENPVF